jgi:DNA-binding MarR family transcriptional regulator
MSLKDELKMNRDFVSVQQEALLSLTRTQSILDPTFNAIFSEHKLTAPQYNILRILKGNTNKDGMSCSAIGERMVTRDSDLTRLLDKLEKAQLVQRQRPEHDRRKVLTLITTKGAETLRQINPKLEQANKKVLGHMKDSDLKKLNQLLNNIRQPHL